MIYKSNTYIYRYADICIIQKTASRKKCIK